MLRRKLLLRYPLALLVTASLALAGAAAIGVSPASAQECSGLARQDDVGGRAEGLCDVATPGRLLAVTDYEAIWNRYCVYQASYSGAHYYQAGPDGTPLTTVTIELLGEASPEDVSRSGYNPTGTYGLLTARCHGPSRSGVGGTFIYAITDPVPVTVLRDRAAARIVIEDPPTASNPSYEDRFAVVQLETWLWLEAGYWERHDESESAGFVQVDVWAHPESVTWSFNNGDEKTCDNPGIAWRRGLDTTTCGHTFTNTSGGYPGDAFAGTATVAWVFSWAINGTPQGEFADPFLATTTFDIQVGEIQVVES